MPKYQEIKASFRMPHDHPLIKRSKKTITLFSFSWLLVYMCWVQIVVDSQHYGSIFVVLRIWECQYLMLQVDGLSSSKIYLVSGHASSGRRVNMESSCFLHFLFFSILCWTWAQSGQCIQHPSIYHSSLPQC